jgi:hypothetical protein
MNVSATGIPVARTNSRRQRLGFDLGRHHVLGKLDVGRAGLLRLGQLEGLANDLRDDGRIGEARVPLRDGTHHAEQVDVLMGLLVHALEITLSGERHEGSAIEKGVGHRRGEVQRTRAEGAQTDARAAGQAPVDVRHVSASLLVTDGHELDARARQGLVEIEGLLAGDSEDVLDALGLEALHEQVRRLACGHPC